MEISPNSLAAARKILQRFVDELSSAPGVYRMFDAGGNILYVGKAKNLRARVAAYAQFDALPDRLKRMVSQIASLDATVTRSEAEALLLEANLVKKHAPRYNILLKDDKSFPYIFFSGDHDYPRIAKHRGPKTKKGKYFGPFVSAGAVNETMVLLQKAFLLRPCADTVFKNRTRPCLQYQIKRCSAPCVAKIGKEEYAGLVDQAQRFLTGKNRQLQDEMTAEMQTLSLKMEFEKASVIRDRIRALTQVQQQHRMDSPSLVDADLFALAREGRHAAVQLFSFRGGRNYGGKAHFPANAAPFSDAEILSDVITQFYQSHPVPGLILTSHVLPDAALIEEALKLNHDYRIEIVHPVRGEKRELIELAGRNAREALQRHLSMHMAQREVLAGVQQLFGLDELPERIEVYDNSHISGANAVGAMIVGGQDGFMKSEYRKFNIKRPDTAPGDDYAMLREVLTRRFLKLEHEEKDAGKMPSLVLIDGGAGQVSAATKVFEELGVNVCYAGIAKGPDRNAGRETFFIPGREPFQLPENDPVLHFLQRLRDEAHRFAIGAHRARRSKSMQTSELDAIPFIGPRRKKALLLHFGSAKAVASASLEDIAKVEGINKTTAKMIYEHFHGN